MSVKLSLLNLVPRLYDESEKDAIDRAVKLAQLVEQLGYQRYWVAEHHNHDGLVSSATEIIVQYLLQHTHSIEIGAGGVMVPNHNTLQVAERYGTLDVLFPKRINLGLGRAPGTDAAAAQLLKQGESSTSYYEQAITDIHHFLSPDSKLDEVIAYPGMGRQVPLFVLGSSLASAHTAAKFGLPYAFAAHFAPYYLEEALEIYRQEFQPSSILNEPYVIVSVLGLANEDREQAEALHSKVMTNISQRFYQPKGSLSFNHLTSADKLAIESVSGIQLVGDAQAIKEAYQEKIENLSINELMIMCYPLEEDLLTTSYQLFSEIFIK